MNTPHALHHDEAMVAALKDNPDLAVEYLNEALAEGELPAGQAAPMMVLRQIALARGLEAVAERAGMSQKRLYQVLQRKGSPTVKTFLAIIRGVGLRLKISRAALYVQDGQLTTCATSQPRPSHLTLASLCAKTYCPHLDSIAWTQRSRWGYRQTPLLKF
jgi:probable addiction module antidote protein